MKRKFAFLTLFFLQSHCLVAADGIWNGLGPNNNWSTAMNWVGMNIPNMAGNTATFSNLTMAPAVTLDMPETIGNFLFDSVTNYEITGTSTLTLMGGGAITITTNNGNGAYTLAMPILLMGNDLTITQGSTGTFTITGIISGSQALSLQGSGVLALTGANMYANGTVINTGTLSISSDGNLGMPTGSVTIANGATLQMPTTPPAVITSTRNIILTGIPSPGIATIDTGSSTVTLATPGVISGAGALTKNGSGMLTLSGNNTYMGGTLINAGTISISSDAPGFTNLGMSPEAVTIGDTATLQITASLSSSRNITLGGTSTIDTNGAATAVTLSGVISSVGSLTKIGLGKLTLTGPNLYQGGTFLTAGTLNISSFQNLGATGSLLTIGAATLQTATSNTFSNPISLTGAAIFDTNGQSPTFSGAIGGTGSLTKINPGTLILSGTSGYTGGTTVTGGTLQGTTSSLFGNISSATAVVFDQSFTGTYAGLLSGAGSLTVEGGGTVEITGTNPFTGPTHVVGTVAGTELSANGNISTSPLLTVDAGAILSGVGTVGNVMNSGTISPGNSSIGVLTIAGDVTFEAGSTLAIEISPGGADRLQVTGTVTISPTSTTINVIPQPGFYGKTVLYTILTSPAIPAGTFSTITSTSPGFTFTPFYSSIELLVTVAQPFLGFPFSSPNTTAVGNNIDQLGFSLSPDLTSILNSLAGQSSAVINNALDQMHPAQYSAFTELQSELNGLLTTTFHRKPSLLCCQNLWRIWAEPFGNMLSIKNHGEQVGFHASTGGLALGCDVEVFDDWIVGIGGAWSNSHLKWHEHRGRGEVNGYYAGLYTDYEIDNFYLGATFLAGADLYDTNRHIHFVTTDRHARADYTAVDIMAQLATAYYFGSPAAHLYPYANFDFLYLNSLPFTEKGAQGLNLSVQSQTNHTLRSEVGIALEVQDTNMADTMCISPRFGFGWVNIWPLRRQLYRSTFQGASIPFHTQGWHETWNLLDIDFGLAISYRCFSLTLDYDLEFSTDEHELLFNQHGNARISWKW